MNIDNTMEPNPGDIYNEGYEAGYKAGKEEIEAAVEAERERIWKLMEQHLEYGEDTDTMYFNSRAIKNGKIVNEYEELEKALTTTNPDKQTEV